MHSSGSPFTAAALVLALAGVWAPCVHGQTPAGVRYQALSEQEQRVSTSAASIGDDFRVVINRYWAFVRRYPTSGYADNALWQAASLSMEAFARFGDVRDKQRATQLFTWLHDQYPHSTLAARVETQIERAAAQSQAESQSPPQPSSITAETTIRAVHRDVLPEVVRVTVELDREVPFYQERLDGPPRLFFDLKGTRAVPALVDATFRYDSDVVRHIRLGRHPNNTTRIVLDLEHVGKYSIFTLYNPYRIVVDSERAAAKPVATTDIETAGAQHVAPVSAPAPRATANTPAAAPVTLDVPSLPVADGVGVPSVTFPFPVSSAASAVVPDVPEDTPGAPDLPGKPVAPSANSSGKFSVARQLGLGVSRIVIDAGHGGHDPGASAFGISESELVLDVAQRLEKLLVQQDGMEVVLTRRSDDFLSLEARTEIANRESADLFLSIHANASATATVRGVETYFLNFALNPQAEAVAARENAASSRTMNSLPGIIKAITLNSKLNESRDFATSIQRALVRGLRPSNKTLRDLGVKQAPFMVLIGASMPSVLAEIAFVTNRQEGRLLKSTNYRQKIAEALLAGILRYQQSLKKVQTAALN